MIFPVIFKNRLNPMKLRDLSGFVLFGIFTAARVPYSLYLLLGLYKEANSSSLLMKSNRGSFKKLVNSSNSVSR